MASTTDVTELLKYRYFGDQPRYLFNEESVVYNIVKSRKMRLDGRGQAILPLITQNAGAVTGITEGGSLPSALQPATTEATFSMQEYVSIHNVSWKLMQDAQRSEAAFQRAVEFLDESLRRRFIRMLNADLIDNGLGRLFVMPAADDQTTITVDAPPLAEAGQVIDIMDDADDDTKRGDSLTVTAVDPIALTVTVDSAPSGTAADNYGVIQDTTDDSLNNALHMNGVLGIIDDANPASVVGNYGGINRSTAGNEFWESSVLDNSGTNRALTEDLILQGFHNAQLKGGGRITHLISNLPIVRRYHELLSTERFFSLSPGQNMRGGVGPADSGDEPDDRGGTVYDYGGVPWHVEPYFRPNTMIGIDNNHIWLGHGGNDAPRPISEIFDNIPFFRQTSNATFEVAFYFQGELMVDAPNRMVKFEDLAES